MISNRVFALVLPLVVAGCVTTTDEVRNAQPAWNAVSHKSPETLSQCIYSGWSTSRVVAKDDTSHTEMIAGRTTVYTWENSMFVDLFPRGKGTDMKFYKTFNMGETVLADRLAIVKNCR